MKDQHVMPLQARPALMAHTPSEEAGYHVAGQMMHPPRLVQLPAQIHFGKDISSRPKATSR